ncbi:hypothetical protein MK525_03145 [Streptococcus gallolyticus subsp. gallolyticus]|uniref:hypothetical protein n=1 Tax=Streptococcus gallolyticus TaxID=315405 RepID=UPI0022848169|nr:hypothetical protein [Streptococcus gallolyticus]MCY7157481.1 hypothetical protein [Streptococcus gallolyticus subsp. gallolyticus]
MNKYLVLERPLFDGYQKIYFFENGYGASVINHSYSQGLEMAVIQEKNDDYRLCYDTPITDDILGYLDENEVEEYLKKIKEL